MEDVASYSMKQILKCSAKILAITLFTGTALGAPEKSNSSVQLTSSFLSLNDLGLSEIVAKKEFWGGLTAGTLQVQDSLVFEPKKSDKTDKPEASVD